MIAAFALGDELEPGILSAPRDVQSVHLTLLKADGGGKADVEKSQLMIGSPGALPIVNAPTCDLFRLGVCEGIEDALSVYEVSGFGVWAAGAAGRMPALANLIPDFIEVVTVFGHADEAGHQAARSRDRARSPQDRSQN
jgi:hypothetical protein